MQIAGSREHDRLAAKRDRPRQRSDGIFDGPCSRPVLRLPGACVGCSLLLDDFGVGAGREACDLLIAIVKEELQRGFQQVIARRQRDPQAFGRHVPADLVKLCVIGHGLDAFSTLPASWSHCPRPDG